MPLSLSVLKDIVAIIQSFATVGALLIGGIWTYLLFVRKRQRYPRAKIEHRISYRPVNGKVLLSLDIIISNSSDVLLSLESGRIDVRQVLPPQGELLSILNGDQGGEITHWQSLAQLRKYEWEKGELEIEPGESHQLPYHIVVDASVETIFVYTYFRNVVKKRRVIGWALTTIHDLSSSNR